MKHDDDEHLQVNRKNRANNARAKRALGKKDKMARDTLVRKRQRGRSGRQTIVGRTRESRDTFQGKDY